MLFWIFALLMAVGALFPLALALVRGGRGADAEASAPAAQYDLQVYRDQLRELKSDAERGLVAPEEAQRLETEISRRLLAADARAQAARPAGAVRRGGTGLALAICAAAAALALALYASLGAPGYGDLALSDRIAQAEQMRAARPSQAQAEEEAAAALAARRPEAAPAYRDLVDRLRAAVEERPGDLQGLRLLARHEAVLGNFDAAHKAQAQVIAARGEDASAQDYATLGDLLVLAAGGYVSPEAEAALTEALRRDPRNGTARYYAGLMLAQTGRPDLAFRRWKTLLEDSRPEDPWVPPIRAQIEDLAMRAGVSYTLPPAASEAPESPVTPEAPEGAAPLPGPLPGPDAEALAAAEEMSAAERQEMIRGMVSRLSDRLASQGGSAAEWARLIGALGVLGEQSRARAIWEEARLVFEGQPEALAQIEDGARRAGLLE